MTEFIGSRISLISKRDIRYVGTLHEISSENSTVALEQVVSFGTEGRRPDDEVPPSNVVYEYIVFRGSDVKDLRIEEAPKENKSSKPQMPDDPAILGSGRRPTPLAAPQFAPQVAPQQQVQDTQSKPSQQASQPQPGQQSQKVQQPQQSQQSQPPQQPQQSQQSQPPQQPQQLQQPQHFSQPQQPPRFPQQPYPFPYQYQPLPNSRYGSQGFPPGPPFPGMPFGGPMYPPPGQAFHQPHFNQYYPLPPLGSVAQQQSPQGLPSSSTPAQQAVVLTGPAASKQEKPIQQQGTPEKPTATVKLPSASTTPGSITLAVRGPPPPPPTESKPDIAAALAPPALPIGKENFLINKPPLSGPKNARIMPAIPRQSPATNPAVPVNGALPSTSGTILAENKQTPAKNEPTRLAPSAPSKTTEAMNKEAKAAVAAAMAKLPSVSAKKNGVNGNAELENPAHNLNETRNNENPRNSRQRGTPGATSSHRGGRGGYRDGRPQGEQPVKKVDVPTTDYDFVSANAKFNKQDLVKEAIATSSSIEISKDAANSTEFPAESSVDGGRKRSESNVIIPITPIYNKSSSFFDNISSESKDRDDVNAKKAGGREFRNEEQKKNLETFGQGSVDNGYRVNYRGRGNGRGRGYGRSRGGYGRGRGAIRGGQGAGTVRAAG